MADRRPHAHGFSLVELSFVIVIILILSVLIAGGGSYLSIQAEGHKLSERARELVAALRAYEGANTNSGFPYPQPPLNDNPALAAALAPFLSSQSSATDYYDNPYSINGQARVAPVPTSAASYPPNFGLANYPLTTNFGRTYYFYKSGAANGASINVWSGTTTRNYLYYAVQVIDHKGYPLFTDGH